MAAGGGRCRGVGEIVLVVFEEFGESVVGDSPQSGGGKSWESSPITFIHL